MTCWWPPIGTPTHTGPTWPQCLYTGMGPRRDGILWRLGHGSGRQVWWVGQQGPGRVVGNYYQWVRLQPQGQTPLRNVARMVGAQQQRCTSVAVMDLARVPPHELWGQALMPGVHRGGYPGIVQGQGGPFEKLHLEKVLTSSLVPTGPHVHPPLHPVCRRQRGGQSHQDPDRSGVQWGLCQGLMEDLFNFTHTELNAAYLVVDSLPLLAQPLQLLLSVRHICQAILHAD